jgi:hypothetical protein
MVKLDKMILPLIFFLAAVLVALPRTLSQERRQNPNLQRDAQLLGVAACGGAGMGKFFRSRAWT